MPFTVQLPGSIPLGGKKGEEKAPPPFRNHEAIFLWSRFFLPFPHVSLLPHFPTSSSLSSLGFYSSAVLSQGYGSSSLSCLLVPEKAVQAMAVFEAEEFTLRSQRPEALDAGAALRIEEEPFSLTCNVETSEGGKARAYLQLANLEQFPLTLGFEGTTSLKNFNVDPNMKAILGCHLPGMFDGQAVMDIFRESYSARFIAQFQQFKFGVEAACKLREEVDVESVLANLRNPGSGWSQRPKLTQLDAAVMYTSKPDTSIMGSLHRDIFGRKDGYFEVGLKVENLGNQYVASYFHHTFLAWRHVALAGEFIHSRRNMISNHLRIGGLWQVSQHSVLKGKIETDGTVSGLLGVCLPFSGFSVILSPSFELDLRRMKEGPRIGLSLSISQEQ